MGPFGGCLFLAEERSSAAEAELPVKPSKKKGKKEKKKHSPPANGTLAAQSAHLSSDQNLLTVGSKMGIKFYMSCIILEPFSS